MPFTANSAPLRSVSDRESYLVQKFENIPEDATLSSAFLREAFKEFFNTVMHRHPNSAFGLSYAGHGTASGGLFQGSISPVDAQLMLRGWADTYQGKIEFLDFGGNCSEGTFATLLNIAPFANYIVASQLPVGGYTMDDWTYEKYKETKEEEQLPLQLAPGRPILTVVKLRLFSTGGGWSTSTRGTT